MNKYQCEIVFRTKKGHDVIEETSYDFDLSAETSQSINKFEQTILPAMFTCIRSAASTFFTRQSEQSALSHAAICDGVVVVNERPYQVDGELGRFTFPTHRVECNGKVIYNSVGDMFEVLRGKEWYKTECFKELALMYGVTEISYQKAEGLLNRIRHQTAFEGTPGRTLCQTVEIEAENLETCQEALATAVLQEHGFDTTGQPLDTPVWQPVSPLPGDDSAHTDKVNAAISSCSVPVEWKEEMAHHPLDYENPFHTVNSAVDDVVVKKQKEERPKERSASKSDGRKFVHDTIAHIEKVDKAADGSTIRSAYVLVDSSVIAVLRLLLAFLFHNALQGYRLQFFVDGQRSLHSAILMMFAWCSKVRLILDWYHLVEKCKMQLSMAMKGRDSRNAVLDELKPLLWHGLWDRAMALLKGLDRDKVKNTEALDKLIGYLERNRELMPCYAVRDKLGLRNSSNIGEKMNDLVVSTRQKHNGMSWSKIGSTALALLTALKRNQEYKKWFQYGILDFKLIPIPAAG